MPSPYHDHEEENESVGNNKEKCNLKAKIGATRVSETPSHLTDLPTRNGNSQSIDSGGEEKNNVVTGTNIHYKKVRPGRLEENEIGEDKLNKSPLSAPDDKCCSPNTLEEDGVKVAEDQINKSPLNAPDDKCGTLKEGEIYRSAPEDKPSLDPVSLNKNSISDDSTSNEPCFHCEEKTENAKMSEHSFTGKEKTVNMEVSDLLPSCQLKHQLKNGAVPGSVRVVVVVVLAVCFSIAAVSSSSAAFYGQKFMAVDQDNKVLTMTCCTSFPLNQSDTVRWDRVEKGKQVEPIAFFHVQKGNDKNGMFEASIDGSCFLMKIYNLTSKDVGANYTLAVGHQNHEKDQVFFYPGSGPKYESFSVFNGKEPLQNAHCNRSNKDIVINFELKHRDQNVTFTFVNENGKKEDLVLRTEHDGLLYTSYINVKRPEVSNGAVKILFLNQRTNESKTIYTCLTMKDKEQKEGVQDWVIVIAVIVACFIIIIIGIRYYRRRRAKRESEPWTGMRSNGGAVTNGNAESLPLTEMPSNEGAVTNGNAGVVHGLSPVPVDERNEDNAL